MKVALVHDWLTGMRGGERVLEELCGLFPDATLFTLLHVPGSVSPTIEAMPIRTSMLGRIPGAGRYYRCLLPLFPWAISRFDLSGFDLVLSVSHAAAKGIRKPAGSMHVCYCLTPMRYIWDMKPDYFPYDDPLRIKRAALNSMLYPLRRWDRATAAAVDYFIADSRFVQERIRRYYGRTASVIYPPVDTGFFTPANGSSAGTYYLVVSALVAYKRVDVAIETFNQLGYPLVVAGTGPDLDRLKSRSGPNITFTGFVSDERLRELYRGCKAVIVTAREDFGLVSLESQACGRPALAFGAGGALESVIDGQTGLLFREQTAGSLTEAVRRLESVRWNPGAARRNAERFAASAFRTALTRFLEDAGRHSRSGSRRNVQRFPRAARKLDRTHKHASLKGFAGVSKRSMDIVLSLFGLLVFGLPLLILAFMVRRSSDGPGFYRQTRVGLGRSKFQIIKLRTMYNDAERHTTAIWAVDNDPRCTPLGSYLRRYGIDELPQLWNVLRGDMSLVGPRPERPEFQKVFESEIPGFGRRLEVRGGVTGLAQVRGWRGNTSIKERLNSDLEYIEKWSFWKDLLILARTPFFLLRQSKPAVGSASYGSDCLESNSR